MEPVSIALICAVSFGAVVAFSVFVRQLLLSHDKNMNDEAQKRALSQEADELAKIREEMKESKSRFSTHYQVLGSNKEAIQYLDQKIDDILQKKAELVHRYAQISLKESSAIVNGEGNGERRDKCHRLQAEIDAEIDFYQKEIEYYQTRRNGLWDTHREFLDHLMDQEKTRNSNLDDLYQKHSAMLQKIILRHNDNAQKIASETITAGTNSFKSMIMAPIMFLMQYFGLAKGVSLDKIKDEIASREEVSEAESDINDSDVENTEAHDSEIEPDTSEDEENDWSESEDDDLVKKQAVIAD